MGPRVVFDNAGFLGAHFPFGKCSRSSLVFDALTDRLSSVFDRLSGRGVLSEKDIDEALREVRVALLEADVALPVVKDFVLT